MDRPGFHDQDEPVPEVIESKMEQIIQSIREIDRLVDQLVSESKLPPQDGHAQGYS